MQFKQTSAEMGKRKNVEYQSICHSKTARSADISPFLFYDILHQQ